jgi:hypothetical protein
MLDVTLNFLAMLMVIAFYAAIITLPVVLCVRLLVL